MGAPIDTRWAPAREERGVSRARMETRRMHARLLLRDLLLSGPPEPAFEPEGCADHPCPFSLGPKESKVGVGGAGIRCRCAEIMLLPNVGRIALGDSNQISPFIKDYGEN